MFIDRVNCKNFQLREERNKRLWLAISLLRELLIPLAITVL